MEETHDLEHSLRYFTGFGKLLGIYPSKWRPPKFISISILVVVTSVDWVGCVSHRSDKKIMTVIDMCGRIGSPQFYTLGLFCYLYIQCNHRKLKNIYENFRKLPVIQVDANLALFVNWVAGTVMTSAILENISYHFRLFPVFEPPIPNKSSFEVYYERSHSYWAELIPFTPIQGTMLLISNKLALYAWNYADLLVIITCRALRFRFEALNNNIGNLDPEYIVHHHAELVEILKLLENYLSPLLFGCFYLNFYATSMQLNMWMTPSNHGHFLYTIYFLWSFIHLLVRVFLLTYQASRLHEISLDVRLGLERIITGNCPDTLRLKISRMEFTPRRQLAISGLGCFFITKRFMLTFVYVAFNFQVFLLQSLNAATADCQK